MGDSKSFLRSVSQGEPEVGRKAFFDYVDELSTLQVSIALRKYKELSFAFFDELLVSTEKLSKVSLQCEKLQKEKAIVQDYCLHQADAVSKMKQLSQAHNFTAAQEKEITSLFQEQFRQRTATEKENRALQVKLDFVERQFSDYKSGIESRLLQLDAKDELVASLQKKVALADEKADEAAFERDRVAAQALGDKQALIDAEAKIVLLDNSIYNAGQMSTKLQEEINLQKSKITELLNLNHELSERHNTLKMLQEAEHLELQDLSKKLKLAAVDNQELVEQLQKAEQRARELLELRATHVEKITQLTRLLQAKESEADELKVLLEEKTDDFNSKLAKKEAQIKILATQLATPATSVRKGVEDSTPSLAA